MNDAKEKFTEEQEIFKYIKYIKEIRVILKLCHTSHLW